MLCEIIVFVLQISYWLNKYACIPDHLQLNDMDEMGDYNPKATPRKLKLRNDSCA